MSRKLVYIFVLVISANVATAELSQIDDEGLSEVTGQSGVYLSGELSINENGGTLQNSYFGTDCTVTTKKCGARLTFQTNQNGGWFVLDNIHGSMSFEGLTLQVRNINSGFGGDGAVFNRDVMEIGLPGTLRMDSFSYTLATSSTARPTDATGAIDVNFKQTDYFTVEMTGDVVLEGNLLVFPTGNP